MASTWIEASDSSHKSPIFLQLQTDGKWLPSKSVTPDPKTTQELVDKIRKHQKKTEFTLQQLKKVVVPAEGQEQLNEDLRDVEENVAATVELVEYLEGLDKKDR